MGSMPSSSEPVRTTTPTTSGNCSISVRCMRRSSPRDSTRLMEGNFSSCTMTLPLSMVGMNVLPMSPNKKVVAASSANATVTTTMAWRRDQASIGS